MRICALITNNKEGKAHVEASCLADSEGLDHARQQNEWADQVGPLRSHPAESMHLEISDLKSQLSDLTAKLTELLNRPEIGEGVRPMESLRVAYD